MAKPDLPRRPEGGSAIDAFSPEWICQLLDCVEWAMNHPSPDGKTIFVTDAGTMRAVTPPPAVPKAGDTMTLVCMTVRPNAGYGPAFCATITLTYEGHWTVTGVAFSTIVPKQV